MAKRIDFETLTREELLAYITRRMAQDRAVGRASERKRRRQQRANLPRWRPTLLTRKRRALEAAAQLDAIALRDPAVAEGRR